MKSITKKLSMTVLIISTLMLSGCGSSNTEESKDNNITEKETTKKENKMSVEETKALTEGQFVEAIDNVTPRIPDEATLEEMGLDYEYAMEVLTSINGGEFTLRDGYVYWYHDRELNNFESETKDENNTYHKKYAVKGVNIIPFVYLYEENGVAFSATLLSDESFAFRELINQDNFQKIQEIIISKITSTYTKERIFYKG